MKSMNKIQLVGYLGRDPEFRTMDNGTLLASLRLATNRWYFPKDAEPKKYTDWHTIKMWGKEQVEKLRNYLIKGSHVLVEGRMVYRSYVDNQGLTHHVSEIHASYLVDLDR